MKSRPLNNAYHTDRVDPAGAPLGSNRNPTSLATKLGPRWGPTFRSSKGVFKTSQTLVCKP